MSRFIPAHHFMTNKMSPEFCKACIDYSWYNTDIKSLLWDKNVEEIEQWATGKIDLTPFKKMYKSIKRDFAKNHPQLKGNPNADQDMQFIRYPAIPPKLNSVVSLVQKIPFEVTCTATDGLAFEKKMEDITFIKNKPKLEEDLQDLADQLQIGKVDLGTTKHSATPFSDSPYGLDLNQPEELTVFVDLIYKLGVEASYETILQIFYDLKNIKQVKLQEIKDQFKLGVSVNRAFQSAMTGLPDFEYVYPGSIKTPHSDLPDYSDNEARFLCKKVTPIELFNLFGNEICNEETLEKIVNGADKFGYCSCNDIKPQPSSNFGNFKMELIYCEVKSIDGVGVVSNPKKSSYAYMQPLTGDKKEDSKCTDKIWAQNTYCFWWLKNTSHFFGIHKLGFAQRTKGLESYQNFTTNIYKSQELSPVELSIDENKKAQVASIKMMYALIMSLPAGKYIDLNFLQQAAIDLKESWGDNVMEQLIDAAYEKNQIIGSSAGFDEKPNMGNFKPFADIAGGVKTEINGYIQTMQQADAKISQFTGANDQLTGQSANPEGLVGLQKLLINGSINSLYWINEGIETQYEKAFNIWAWVIKQAIEEGGKTKEAVANMIGSKKANIIDRMDEIPLHTMGVSFSIFQREEERAKVEERIKKLNDMGVLSVADLYMLDAIQNPKDKYALAAVKEMQWQKRQEGIRQQQMEQQQALMQQQGQNQIEAENAKAEGKNKNIYAQGEVTAKVTQLANELGLNALQLEGLIKKQLQTERGNMQLDKSIRTLETKANLSSQDILSR